MQLRGSKDWEDFIFSYHPLEIPLRILAAFAAASFFIAPVPDGHAVTLRIDTVAPGQQAKVDVKSSVPGLHLGNSSATASNQLSVSTPASVIVDANVDGVMIDAQNGTAV